MATSSRWLHHLRLSPLSSLRDVWRRIDLLQQYVLLDYVRAEADKKLDDTSRQALIAELEAAREAFRCQLLRDRMGDDRVSSGWSGSIIKGDLVFANYSNWGWWPCKLVGIRAAKDRVQVEIYFFPGYSNPLTPSQPVTEWSKDWVDAEQVCSFLENFQQLSRAVPSTGSMFAWFSHDLSAALEYFVETEMQPGAAGRGSVGSWDEAGWYASVGEALLGPPKRERWGAMLDRFTELLESWRMQLTRHPMEVPVPTELALFAVDGTAVGQAGGASNSETDPAPEDAPLPTSTVRAEDDLYCVLGVSAKASTDEIRNAHRHLARKFHPDRPEGNTALFQRLQEAIATLRSAKHRRAYDAKRAAFFRTIEQADREEAREREQRHAAALLATRRSGRCKRSADSSGSVPMLCGVHLVTASHREMRGKRVDESKVLHNWYRSMSGNDPLVEAVLARSSQMMTTLTTVQSIVPSLAPLLVAVEVNHEAMAQMLLGVKPDLALETTTPVLHLSRSPARAPGWTVLHHAALLGRAQLLRPIVEAANAAQERQWRSVYGSKITGASGKSGPGRVKSGGTSSSWSPTRLYTRGDHHGMTALHIAAKHGQAEAVRELIVLGADPMQRCQQKFTALHWICGEKVNRGHVAAASALMDASREVVNTPDKNGLTALHWANAEQHVGLMKLLLNRGAVWSDKDLEAMMDDVTLGHEHKPIKIDLSCCFEEGADVEATAGAPAVRSTSSDLSKFEGRGREIAKELLSRLRRFVYIRDPVVESDEVTNNSLKHEDDDDTDEESDDSSVVHKPADLPSKKRSAAAMRSNSKTRESRDPRQKHPPGQLIGCNCVNCFDSRKRCACIRKNGEYLPYRPIFDPETGAVAGMVLEQERLGMMRTRIFECGKDCVNHRRFRALDNPETGASEVCVTSAKSTKSKKRAKSSKRSKSAKAASAPVGPKLSRAQLEVLRQRKFYEARWCSGLNFCQQGVSPAVTLKGFRNGKGFGVVTDVSLRKGQYVCTYNAEILSADDASERETMWCESNGQLGGMEVLPENYGNLSTSGHGGSSSTSTTTSSSSSSSKLATAASDSTSAPSFESLSSSISSRRTIDPAGQKKKGSKTPDMLKSGPRTSSESTSITASSCAKTREWSRAHDTSFAGESKRSVGSADLVGTRCEVEFNGEWYAGSVEFDRRSGRSVKCDIDKCSVIVPFTELKSRIRGIGGGASEAAEAPDEDVAFPELHTLPKRRKTSTRSEAIVGQRTSASTGGIDEEPSCEVQASMDEDVFARDWLCGQSPRAMSNRDSSLQSVASSLESSSAHSSNASTSPPTSTGTASPAVLHEDLDLMFEDTELEKVDGEADPTIESCPEDTDSADGTEFVPGALMEQVTFQIYLDKSCNNKVFDGTIFANIARFMNHSCDPNLKVIKVDCGRPYPLLAFFCTRNVGAGEELTWNYDNSGGGRKKTNGVVCLCGAANCRGFL